MCMLSHVRLFVTPRTAARQAPLSLENPGKNTGVGCHFFLQGIVLNQGLNPHRLCVLHWQADSLPLSHLGNPLRSVIDPSSASYSGASPPLFTGLGDFRPV